MKRPTQTDVARVAGVSRATVSYVLNDPSDQRITISPGTRQRVLAAVAELGYEVDARAQALRSGETRTIGVLLPMYENPFYWQILIGISAEAEEAGYGVLLARNSVTPEQEYQSIRELAQQRVDGLVLLRGFKLLTKPVLHQLRKSSRPIVEISGEESEFDYVRQGYGDGTRALMVHLFELGHRRVGFVYGVSLEAQGLDRLEAYRRALQHAGLPGDESLVCRCGPYLEDGYQAAIELLRRPDRPTAILAINDLLGLAVVRAAADLELRVPQDVSVASFDDIPFMKYSVPRLTTVAGYPAQNGREAVRLLLQRLADPTRPRASESSGWQLFVRESTGPAPGT